MLRRCGLKDVLNVIKVRRLRWYGYVARRSSEEELGRVSGFEIGGRRPRGRPKKTWMDCVRSDMGMIGARQEDALDRQRWEQVIKRLTP